MSTLLEKTAAELQAVRDAKAAYEARVAEIQAECDHPTILKHTTEGYMTYRVCEECGYNERSQWDSGYRYKDQRLLKRSYDVSWSEFYRAKPREVDMLSD